MKTQQTHTPPLEETHRYETEEPVSPPESELTDRRLQSINPTDQTVVGEVEMTPAVESNELVERARETQRAWRRRPLQRRIRQGRAIFHELLEWRQELVELIVDETGKSGLEARRELWKTWQEVGEMLSSADDRLGRQSEHRWTTGRRTESRWQPRGVVLIVASGYAPLQTTVAPAMAAILAGNTAVIVGDDQAPLTVQSLVNIATSMGVPDRLWTAVVGDGQLIDGLANQADAIVSYGPPQMTRRLARRQAGRMIPVVGRWKTRDVMVVLADADLRAAACAAVQGSCSGSGRSRRALQRIYVQKSVVDPFVDEVVEQIGVLRQANRGDQRGMEIGPLSDPEQLEKTEKCVDDASRSGARLVAGGRRRPRCRGNYFEPTVLTGVDESMRLWKEGVVGPVVAIAPVEAVAEAVQRTRDIPDYGAVSLFTENREVASNTAPRLGAPVIGINEVVREVPVGSPAVRGTIDGPLDPVGADRLRALSRRVLTVENRRGVLPMMLEAKTPQRLEKALDTALSMVHRRGWLRKTLTSVLPGTDGVD